jgi:hypothetical protein
METIGFRVGKKAPGLRVFFKFKRVGVQGVLIFFNNNRNFSCMSIFFLDIIVICFSIPTIFKIFFSSITSPYKN